MIQIQRGVTNPNKEIRELAVGQPYCYYLLAMRRSNDNIWCHQTPTTFMLPVALEQRNHIRVTAFWGVRTSNNARVENLGRSVIFDEGREQGSTQRFEAAQTKKRGMKATMNE
jgi:hypothetical protein